MHKDRRAAALIVAEKLFEAEAAIDNALACAAALNGTMVTARTSANLSAIVGQEAFKVTAAAFAALVQAREEIVEAHKRLNETKSQIGLRTFAVGETEKPPLFEGADGRHLQSVA